jgi:hypothetical protein
MVLLRGQFTEVLGIHRRGLDMVYLQLAGVDGLTSYARVLLPPSASDAHMGSFRWFVHSDVVEPLVDLAITTLALAVYGLDRCTSWLRGIAPTAQPHLASRAIALRPSR